MDGMWCSRWLGYVTRRNEDDFVKTVNEGRVEGEGIKGRPPVKWINRVDEYWRVGWQARDWM